MKDTIYVVFTKDKIRNTYKTPPSLKRDEHAVCLKVDVDDSYFRAAIPEHRLRIGPEDLIRPEVGVVVDTREGEDGEGGETVVKDPQTYVDEVVSDVLAGDEVAGLPEWAYHAVLAELSEKPAVQAGHVEVEHGLERVREDDGHEHAVLVVRGVRG